MNTFSVFKPKLFHSNVLTFGRKKAPIVAHEIVQKRFLQAVFVVQQLPYQIRMARTKNQLRTSPKLNQPIAPAEHLEQHVEPVRVALPEHDVAVADQWVHRFHFRPELSEAVLSPVVPEEHAQERHEKQE